MSKELIILIVILGITALVALISYIVYRYLHPRLKEEKPSEEQLLKEEMDRMLQPIEDEKIAKEVEAYKEKEDE